MIKKSIFTLAFLAVMGWVSAQSLQFEKDGYVILEITDITDPLHIFVEDKSRGSDYGD